MPAAEQQQHLCLGERCEAWQNLAFLAGGISQYPERVQQEIMESQSACDLGDSCDLETEATKDRLVEYGLHIEDYQNAT